MRNTILILSALLIFGCSSKSAHDDAEVITRVGVIKQKQDVSMQQVESDSKRANTSVYGSVSSGGGVSIGIGFLFSQLGSSGRSDAKPVRYEVELQSGGQMTIYHDSRDFEVDDCVEIRVHPNEKKHPPTMQRNKDGCA